MNRHHQSWPWALRRFGHAGRSAASGAVRLLRDVAVITCIALSVESAAAGPASAAPSVETLPSAQAPHEGTLIRYVATLADGRSERRYSLQVAGALPLHLRFDTPPSAETGSRLRVWGDVESAGLHVQRFEDLTLPHALDVTPQVTPVAETYAFILVDVGGGVGITAADAQKAIFSTTPADKSFADFYAESSYGQYAVQGEVLGPMTFPDTMCNTDAMAAALEPMITTPYDHYIYYIGQEEDACDFTGLAEEGSVTRHAKRTWLNASDGCVVSDQEPGHNLGMQHSNTITCPGASFSATVSTSCTLKEYGDRLTPMGSGCRQLNGVEKWYEHWISGCNGVRVTTSGTFNLVPHESQCPGAVQVLQIPMPTTQSVMDPEGGNETLRNYYVELRAPVGVFDATLTPTVAVYVADDVPPTRTGRHSYILDMNPSTARTFDGLAQGQTFTDPGGALTITLESVSATGASVKVVVPNGTGAPTCIDGTALTGSGPAACTGSSSGGTSSGEADGGAGGQDATTGSGSESGSGSAGSGDTSSGSSSGSGGGATGGSNGGSGSSSGTSGGTTPGSGSGSNGGGEGAGGSSGGFTGSPDASVSSGSDNAGFGGTASTGGCACEAVGGRDRRANPLWVGLGLFVGLALVSRSRRHARRG